MAKKPAAIKGFTVTPHIGDAKTLLAFNLPDRKSATNLAGFTIQCKPDGLPAYYIQNMLQFQNPAAHTQDSSEPPNSTINAPIHKFRWLHVPGSVHQGTTPSLGKYTYTVTPRFFDSANSLEPLDPAKSISVDVNVAPYKSGPLELGFTRGFVQSQAFVHHFGLKALIQPKAKDILFDTSQESGANASGHKYTYQEEYAWLGFTAREKLFAVLNQVLGDKTLHLDVFAYDLNEPDVLRALLTLAKEGRVRVILDDAPLHHDAKSPKAEDKFEALFKKAAKTQPKTGRAAMLRGCFGRFAHDKILIVSTAAGAVKVLTGSTNLSITGLYVNSNHVLVFDDAPIAAHYQEVFDAAWKDKLSAPKFIQSTLSSTPFASTSPSLPRIEFTFSPHNAPEADRVLGAIAARIAAEGRKKSRGSVLFAVMQLDSGTGPVFPALQSLHASENIFSFGISDSPGGIALYKPGSKSGVLVTGKPVGTKLPPPFDAVPNLGLGHQVHHKFIVCGFNSDDPVVYCGSSNLALQGEKVNGDNLLAIHDAQVATVFAIEALALVDHFQFLSRASAAPKVKPSKPLASKVAAATSAGWFLGVTDKWVEPYFDKNDLHFVDRMLFA